MQRVQARAFSLIELLIVMAIIGLMASITIVNLTNVTRRSRDAKRKTDLAEVNKALKLYFDEYKHYPANADDGSGWDRSDQNGFLTVLQNANILGATVADPRNNGGFFYAYKLYNPIDTVCNNTFYVLAASRLEYEEAMTPGIQCGINWDTQFDYLLIEGE